MRKPIIQFHLFGEFICWKLFLLVFFFSHSSCKNNFNKAQITVDKTDSVKSPLKVSGKPPMLVLLDTCPPPRTVNIPTKPGGFFPRKSDVGIKMVQSMPLEKRKAGLFAPMQNFNTEQGLAQGTVYSIAEDKNGILWFATAGAGVSRYDGKSFTTFTIAHGLINNFIMTGLGDSRRNMWFLPLQNGIGCYDGRTFTNYTKANGLVSDNVWAAIEDKGGNMWFGTTDGLSRFDPDGKSFKNFTSANGLPDKSIACLLEDKEENIWLGLWGGVCRMDKERKSFTNYPDITGKTVNSLLEDHNGNLYVGCYEGLFYLANEEKSMPPGKVRFRKIGNEKNLPSSIILGMLQDKTGKIWLATRAGLSCFDPNSPSFRDGSPEITNYSKEQGLSSNNILAIHEDKKGNLWIASNGGGVSRLDQGGRTITTFTTEQGLAENHIFCIVKDKKNNLWFGTEGGISVLDPEEKSFKNITTAQGLVDYWTFSIAEDKNNNIWFCTQGDGLSRMDPEWKSITTYSTAQGLPSGLVTYIFEDKNGIIWVGSEAGISLYDGRTITNYTSEQGVDVNYLVNQIIEDRKGNIWVGTEAGIYRFNLPGKFQPGASFEITHFTTGQGLAHNSVKTILEDNSGNLWFGTLGNGFSRYDGKTFLNFGTVDGLPDDGVYDIEKASDDNIWIGTNKGVTILKGFSGKSKYPPGKLSNDEIVNGGYKPIFETFHNTTGYPIKDIYGNALYLSEKNILWAGTGENLVRFDYGSVFRDTSIPKVFIQNLKINNEQVTWYHLLSSISGNKKQQPESHRLAAGITEEVTLFGRRLNEKQRDSLVRKFSDIRFDSITPFYPVPVNPILTYRYNDISFDFAAVETAKPALVRYQYILQGYNDNWSPATDKTTASFGNIPEGNYTFKLKAHNPDGVWSVPLIYNFRVLPPWYRSWWAYVSYACLFFIAISAFIRWRIKALKKEKAFLEEKVTMRTHELQEEKEKVEDTLAELKSTQSQLIQSAKMASLGELTAGIAHEIQNPLNFVNNFSEVNTELVDELKTELATGNRQQAIEIADSIKENELKINHHGKRADAIVKGMLQHSRTSSGQKELTDINALADEYLRLSYHGLRAKDKTFNATLKTDFDERIGNINIIRQDIGRVILNLINNAFYAVSEKQNQNIPGYEPTVTVSTKKLRDHLEIRVTDNGTGIPQKALEKIFQPFFTTKPTGQGTGLGLSLAYDIVMAHSGELKVETTVGERSEFIIQLPVV